MQTLTLKSYLSTIFPLLKDCESFKGENDLLAELVCSPDNGAFFETYGENSQAKTLSKIKAGGMTKEHAKIFQGDQARINIKERINNRIVYNIRYGRRDFLVEILSNLITTDTTIDDDAKKELLTNASRDNLADFLTDILLFLVNSTPFDTEAQLTKIPPSEATLLIREAMPELFKTLVAFSFPELEDVPEAIDALKQNNFSAFLYTLAVNKKISQREYRHWMNTAMIIGLAGEEVKKDSKRANDEYYPEDYDVDWFIEFFEQAGKIGRGELQVLWAKVLAGEILRPGVVSPSTLQVMLNFSPQDAELLTQLSIKTFAEFGYYNPPLLFVSDFTPDSDGRNISLAGTRPLIEAGILSSPETITVKGMLGFIDREKFAVVIHSKENRPYNFSFTREVLTRAGRELVASLGSKKAKGIEDEAVRLRHRLSEDYTVKIHRVRFKDNLWLFYTSTLEEQQFTFQDIFPDLTDYFETKSALNQLTDCCSEFQKLYLERIEKQYKVSPQDIQHFIEYLPEGLKEVSPSIVDLYVKLFTDHPEYAEYILTDADLPLFIYKPEEYRDYCIKMLDSIPSYQEITHFLKRVEEHEKKYPYSFHERRKSYGVPFLDI